MNKKGKKTPTNVEASQTKKKLFKLVGHVDHENILHSRSRKAPETCEPHKTH